MNAGTPMAQMVRATVIAVLMGACSPARTTPSPTPILPTTAPTLEPTATPSPVSSEFSIHLLAPSTRAHRPPRLDEFDIEPEPILAIDDIIAYSWGTHEIELTPSAYERIQALDVPVDGAFFAVCLGGEPVYAGAFWPMFSSLSYDGVVVVVPLTDEPIMQISLGYPSSSFFTGEDPRSDPKIRRSLEQAGVLR